MAINSVRKGYRSQKKTEDWLKIRGWNVYTVKKVSYKSKVNQDIFGIFDHIAYRRGRIKLIQTKSNYCRPKVREKVGNFICPEGVEKEIFVWIDYQKHPKVIRYEKEDKKQMPPFLVGRLS